jgi:hypothetical protein
MTAQLKGRQVLKGHPGQEQLLKISESGRSGKRTGQLAASAVAQMGSLSNELVAAPMMFLLLLKRIQRLQKKWSAVDRSEITQAIDNMLR